MEQNKEVIDVLNDLVQINNDRIEGYEKAIKDTKSDGSGYPELFNQMIRQSEEYKQELINEINTLGGDADTKSTTASGKIYRAWMDVKSAFAGKSEKSSLELCEFGEDAAQKAYKEALSSNHLPGHTRLLLESEKEKLKESHDLIKRNRDMQKSIS